MIDQDLIYYDLCKGYCNNDFGGVELSSAPVLIQAAVAMLKQSEANKVRGVKSKTTEDIVIESYTAESMPKDIKQMLNHSGTKQMAF
jgi:hypothetical protein